MLMPLLKDRWLEILQNEESLEVTLSSINDYIILSQRCVLQSLGAWISMFLKVQNVSAEK